MKKTPVQSATSLPMSPDEERRVRMIKYSVAMGIRFVCVVLIFVLPDWWRLIPAIGTVILPYIAVVVANTVTQEPPSTVERPGALVPIPLPRDSGPTQ